jgi:predicted nucleic acid-binding protein
MADVGSVPGHVMLETYSVLTLLPVLAAHGIRGGAVYDALVGATARHHGRSLITRDRRARTTYDAVGVSYSLT